jgi:hypothetical protein
MRLKPLYLPAQRPGYSGWRWGFLWSELVGLDVPERRGGVSHHGDDGLLSGRRPAPPGVEHAA